MSSLPEATRSLMQVFNGKLQDFTNEIDTVHMVWLEEIQQEAHRMFSSDFSTEPELMPKTPSQKKTNRRRRVSTELNESRSKRRFSQGKRSNLRRSSVQMTLNTISELVAPHIPNDSSESLVEGPARRTRRNKTAAPAETEPVKRSTRNKGGTVTKEVAESVPEPVEVQDQILVSEAVVKIPSSERLSADLMLDAGLSPGRSANKIPIAGDRPRGSSRTSARRSQVVRRSLVGLRHSMTQEAVRRASRRSFLKKKARLGNSTCSSSVSEDICMDIEPEDIENKEEQVDAPQKTADPPTETNPEPEIVQIEEPEPEKTEEKETELKEDKLPEAISESPSSVENSRITRSMARTSDSDESSRSKSRGDVRPMRSGSKRQAAESRIREINTPKKKPSPPKKCLTSIAPHMRSFVHTVQKNQMLMMTPGSLGRNSVMKSFIKQSATKTDVKLVSVSVERERQKWDALNKKIEQENERKLKIEEERRKKQEEMKRKRDERLKRVVEARVKGEKEKEQEKKKKIEEKLALLEKKNDLMRVERIAEEKAKRKVATKRQEELELRKKQEEAARLKKVQQAEEEERRHQEMLAKRKAEEEREKARKLAEATRALELKKEQEREKEKERERERERERQAAAEKERLEREKAIALQKELERAAREKERREMEEKRKMEEQRRAEQEREAQQKRDAALAASASHAATAQVSKTQASKMLNSTITKGSALNMTVDIETSVMKTPVGKGAAQNETVDLGAGLNVTVDIEQSPQSYQITPKGQKVTVLVNPDDYGMDQNSDDSTDDESAPRKPIPSWAEGMQLQQAIMKHYYNPLDLHSYFGKPEPPKLEEIFRRTKPRFFKRTSSAVWHSPPRLGNLGN
ncbi:inner centromere protein A isoform X1 [Pimephales promelas]|uniref:inner centromere protein A isoform X1 n=1 Tax=Pimephales promelas TaxID=90988 RepID=UPI001955E3BB|nr:inner centromere protein A isoform X1 [Pimephales promelas]